MKISQKINDIMINKIQPLALKFEKQPHICAIKNGFIVLLPLLIVGSFMMILLIPPFDQNTTNSFGKAWLQLAKDLGPSLWRVFQMTFNSIGLFASASIAYYLAKEYKLLPLHTALLSLVSFLLVCMPYNENLADITYLGGKGLFLAIFIAFYTVELTRFITKNNLCIRLPKEVPDTVAESFNILIPIICVLITLYPLTLITESLYDTSVPVLVEKFLKPLVQASDSIYTLLFLTFIIHILWFFGVNGALIFMQLWTPFLLVNLNSNLLAFQSGEPLPFIVTNGFWDFYVTHGGSGGLVSLALCLVLFARSKLCKTIGRVGLVPTFFSIGEPIMYGLPVILNPIFAFPMIINPLLNATIAYFATQYNIIPSMIILAPWTTPAPIGAFIATGGSIGAAILSIMLIILNCFIYYPFVKLYDKICLQKQ